MTDHGRIVLGGVSEAVWKRLDEDWGTQAKDFRQLNLFRNYQGSYKHLVIPPEKLDEQNFFDNNPKVSLLQIRYGFIPGLNDEQPCLWFLLRHEPDPDGQISTQALLQIFFYVCEATVGKKQWVPIAEESPSDVVNKATRYGQDVYVLVAKIFDHKEWPGIEAKLKGNLGKGEPLCVHMRNSQQFIGHRRGCIWMAEDIMF